MRSSLLFAGLLLVAIFVPFAPVASARPCMEDTSCCFGVILPDGTCFELPCGDGIWGPCMEARVGFALHCVAIIDQPDLGEAVCVSSTNPGCPVEWRHTTLHGTQSTCVGI
jgi:hypothetical protein